MQSYLENGYNTFLNIDSLTLTLGKGFGNDTINSSNVDAFVETDALPPVPEQSGFPVIETGYNINLNGARLEVRDGTTVLGYFGIGSAALPDWPDDFLDTPFFRSDYAAVYELREVRYLTGYGQGSDLEITNDQGITISCPYTLSLSSTTGGGIFFGGCELTDISNIITPQISGESINRDITLIPYQESYTVKVHGTYIQGKDDGTTGLYNFKSLVLKAQTSSSGLGAGEIIYYDSGGTNEFMCKKSAATVYKFDLTAI